MAPLSGARFSTTKKKKQMATIDRSEEVVKFPCNQSSTSPATMLFSMAIIALRHSGEGEEILLKLRI